MSTENLTEAEVTESLSSDSIGEADVPKQESSAILALENDYRTVLTELEKIEETDVIVPLFTGIFEALRTSNRNEQTLQMECRDLQEQLATNISKVNIGMQLQSSDKDTIDELKKEIEKCWKTVDAVHAREQIALETIENLRLQIGRLNVEIEIKSRDTDQSDEFGTASKNKDVLARERERLIQEVTTTKEKMMESLAVQEELTRKFSATDFKLNEVTQTLQGQIAEASKFDRIKQHLEAEISNGEAKLAAKDEEIKAVEKVVEMLNRNIGRLEHSVKEAKQATERVLRDNDSLKWKVEKARLDYESQEKILDNMNEDMAKKDKEILMKEEEICRTRNEIHKLTKANEMYEKKLEQGVARRELLEEEKTNLKNNISSLIRDRDARAKQGEVDAKTILQAEKEREALLKNASKASKNAQEQMFLLKIREQASKKLEVEIDEYAVQVYKQKKAILSLENDRNRYINEATDLSQQVQDTIEEVKLKQQTISECKKSIKDLETKLRMQQNLFEQVRADRNTYSKNLLESQDQITDFKQKLKTTTHQIEQLKEDITVKETQLMREEFALQKCEKEKEGFRVDALKSVKEVKECRGVILEMQTEQNKLHRIISDADEEKEKKKKEMEQIMNERDIIGTQLVRRNDELSLLYEKVRILEATLHKGEASYEQRLEDIRLLKLEIRRMRQEKAALSKNITNMADLRQEILHLERDLTRESLKCRALEEELQNPLNIHRWRKLEGSDPGAYQLIQKIQILQRRQIAASDAALEREQQLEETAQMNLNLQQMLMRQPGPESAERTIRLQQGLKDRDTKIKCLVAELNMFEAQAVEHKLDMDRLKQELNELKKKYYAQKRVDDKNKAESQMPAAVSSKSTRRFTGGGFSLDPGRRASAGDM